MERYLVLENFHVFVPQDEGGSEIFSYIFLASIFSSCQSKISSCKSNSLSIEFSFWWVEEWERCSL